MKNEKLQIHSIEFSCEGVKKGNYKHKGNYKIKLYNCQVDLINEMR